MDIPPIFHVMIFMIYYFDNLRLLNVSFPPYNGFLIHEQQLIHSVCLGLRLYCLESDLILVTLVASNFIYLDLKRAKRLN